MTLPWLTDAEVDDICAGLTQSAAQVRYLSEVLKVPGVRRKPNGRPLVPRAPCEAALEGLPAALRKRQARPQPVRQPNAAGLVLAYQRKG